MDKIFSTRLKSLRGNESQKAVAARLGVAQQTYGGWEMGQREPSFTALRGIALAFGVSADWLLGLSDVRSGGGVSQSIAASPHASNVAGGAAPSCRDCPTVARLADVIAKFAAR